MRVAYVLAIACGVVFTSAVAVTQDQTGTAAAPLAPPAEKVFKNIKSFTGKPANQIVPSMQFMCVSLGQKCEYCHTQDFASDEKRPKESAREMVAMQNDINQKFFDGHT